jgi:thiamine biosynthesis lipoprotein ApbE
MTADALATALFAMGAGAGTEFARQQGLAALFLLRTDAGLTEIKTPLLAPYILA